MSVNQDYANNVSRILLGLGDDKAKGSLIQGANLSGYLRDLGQTIALKPERDLRLKQIEAETEDLKARAAQRAQGQPSDAIAKIMQESGGDLNVALPKIMAVDPVRGANLQKVMTEAQKERLALVNLTLDHDQKVGEYVGRYMNPETVKDEASYQDAKAALRALDLPTDGMADSYSPQEVEKWWRGAQSVQEQIAAMKKQPQAPSTTGLAMIAEGVPAGQEPSAEQAAAVLGRLNPPKEPTPKAPPDVGSFSDYVTRAYGPNPTAEQVTAARKAYGQADDRPRVSVSVDGSAPTKLTPDAVADTATAYRILGPRGIPTRISGEERARILNEAAKQTRAVGQTAAQMVQKQFAIKADSTSLTNATKVRDSAASFENKALAQTDIIADLSAKVPRTRFPIINSALQAGRTNIAGDENATKLANAIETFSEEYAKIITGTTSGSAAASDSARTASKRLINAAMNQGTMQGVIDLMKKEMGLTLKGWDATIGDITDRMGGSPTPAPSNTPAVEMWERGPDGKMRKVVKP